MEDKLDIDFVGIGAAKSGSTWLARCLADHPQVFIPEQKEIMFFDHDREGGRYRKGVDWYRSFFRGAGPGQVKGEFCTQYIVAPESSRLIKKHLPNAKLLVVLRNPVDMLYSFYWWRRANFESLAMPSTFEEMLGQGNYFEERGLYYEQLAKFYNDFPQENIKVVLFDDIVADPEGVMTAVYQFLGIDESFSSHHLRKKENSSKKVRSTAMAAMAGLTYKTVRKLGFQRLAQFLTHDYRVSKLYTLLNKQSYEYPKLHPDTRKRLVDYYREDVTKLEGLLGKDLSAWKEKNA